MHDGTLCKRRLYYAEYCIFHSENINPKNQDFKSEFQKEREQMCKDKDYYDFTGFVFPENFENISITNKFETDVYFVEAKFRGKANFSKFEFSGKADFRDARFKENAEFEKVQFHRDSDFTGAKFISEAFFRRVQFHRNADFKGAMFKKADFSGSRFSGYADFSEAKFKKADFIIAKFKEASFIRSIFCEHANFREAQFSGHADFSEVQFDKNIEYLSFDYTHFFYVTGLLEFIEEDKKKRKKKRIFKYSKKPRLEFLPENFRLILGEEATARYPVISRKTRDDMYLLDYQKLHPCRYKIWQCFANCGRRFRNLVIWCIALVSIFATIYCCNAHAIKPDYIDQSGSWVSYLYYSVVTFSTLGFGDIVPLTKGMQIIVAIEVIVGYIMLGFLISILANKLARRS